MCNYNYAPTTLGYKVEEKMYLGLRERKRLNITGLYDSSRCLLNQYIFCTSKACTTVEVIRPDDGLEIKPKLVA